MNTPSNAANEMAPPGRAARLGRFAAHLVGLFVSVAVLCGLGAAAFGAEATIAWLSGTVALIRWWAIAVQCALLALLWWRWTALIHLLVARGRIAPRRQTEALAARTRTVALLALAILLFGIGFSNPFH